jgi:hypothetical protein
MAKLKDKGWFAAEVLLGDVSKRQARKEKRGERHMRYHQIQYTDKTLEWALLSWPDRPTRARRAGEPRSTKFRFRSSSADGPSH